jgi:hypothetical protein
MAAPESLVNSPHRGSFFHAEWELRVTERCLEQDFSPATSRSALARMSDICSIATLPRCVIVARRT